jgi:histidinol-phosphate aminotransferase
MSLSRRGFFRSVSPLASESPSGTLIAFRGHEALVGEGHTEYQQRAATAAAAAGNGNDIRLMSNENPLGPGKVALDALVGKFPEAMRYPFNATPGESHLTSELAQFYKTKNENIVLAAGSAEILRNAVRAFTSASKPLVEAQSTYETTSRTAKLIGTPVKPVALDANLRYDLDGIAAAATGAGLVFICNPNNPTATVHGLKAITACVEKIRRASPDTVILIDEAYHDYVTDPAYSTAVPLALSTPNVFVSRTLSKAYGMAGLRIGYGVGMPDTIKQLARFRMPYGQSVPGMAAAIASLHDQAHIAEERQRNTAVRDFTKQFFTSLGYKMTEAQTNFVFVDLRRPSAAFRDACAAQGVRVGRDFPPYDKSWTRISLGTMDEMKRATEVFRRILGGTSTSARG